MRDNALSGTKCIWKAGVFALLVSFGQGILQPAIAQHAPAPLELTAGGPRFLMSVSEKSAKNNSELRDASQAAVFRQRISLDLRDVTRETALLEIAKRSGLHLTYSATVVDLTAPITISVSELTVGAALSAVLYDAGVDVLLTSNGRAALVKRPQAASLQQSGSITGQVTDGETKQPIMGANIRLDGTRFGTMTNDSGQFRLAGVPAGTYKITARRLGYTLGSKSVTVNDDQVATVSFSLEKSVATLEQVVTTGTLVPTEVKALTTPITVITAEDIERQHPRRLDDLLRLAIPGAVVWEPDATGSGSNHTAIALRGASSMNSVDAGADNPKIYIDGIEVYDFTTLSLDVESVDRVEVVRGPQAAAIYGSDAMGGVINIFTKHGSAKPRPEITAQAALGRIESPFPESGALRQEYTGAVSGSTGSASFRAGGAYRKTNPWLPDFRESRPSVNGAMRYEQGPLEVGLSARYDVTTFMAGRNTLTGYLIGTPYCGAGCSVPSNMQTQTRSETYGLRVAYKPLSWWQHEVTVGLDRSLTSNKQLAPTLVTPDDTLLFYQSNDGQRRSFAYHTVATARLTPGISGTLTAGADHYSAPDFSVSGMTISTLPLVFVPGQPPSFYRAEGTNTGVFSQLQLNIHDAFFVEGSLRTEKNSNLGENGQWPLSKKIGATYAHEVPWGTVKLRTSYGQAIRPPFFGAKDSIDYGYLIQVANRDLRPERQSGPDGGVDLYFGRRGSLSVTYYDQTARDFLFLLYDFATLPYTAQYVNIAKVKNTGWEFEGTLTEAWLTAHATFALTHSEIKDMGPVPDNAYQHVGAQIIAIPERTGSLTLTAAPIERTSLTAGLAYVSKSINSDGLAFNRCALGTGPCRGPSLDPADYIITYPSTVKINVSVDQRLSRELSAFLTVEDLANTGSKRAASTNQVLPGRTSTLGLRIKY